MALGALAIGAGVAGIGSYLMSKYGVQGPGRLKRDVGKEYYSQGRVSTMMEPTRLELLADLERKSAQAMEEWGGRGLPSSAGRRAVTTGYEDVHSQALAKASAEASAQEMQTATSLGLADYLQRVEEAQAERERWAQLGGQLLRIPAYQSIMPPQTNVDVGGIMTDWEERKRRLDELIRQGSIPRVPSPSGIGYEPPKPDFPFPGDYPTPFPIRRWYGK